jgi:lipopolysaccharide/colanic/teichoic acid biosynthesis glycosyltransferase
MLFETLKRIFDIAGSILLLAVFSPVILVTYIAIKLTSPGPALVEKTNAHMKRMGKKGKIFRLYKFRSMMVNADKLEKTHPKYRTAYIQKHSSGNYKPTNDPRIFPVGKFIRKHSIDELPQLLNVLRGEMSLVGPRPYLAEELEEQQRKFPGTEKYVAEMLKVKPGITGYWQVSGRTEVNFDKRIALDAYYAKKRSILLDLLILLKTPFVMISGQGGI